MGTIAKALQLLTHFSTDQPEIGLTRFVKLTGDDKATVHRRLGELRESGFLHQDPVTKAYRLGPAISRLEIVKERTFPARRSAMDAIRILNGKVAETAHVSVMQGTSGLSTLAHIDDQRHGIRVHVDANEILPYHATASGLVTLAHMDQSQAEKIIRQGLPAFTADTLTNSQQLRADLHQICATGHARCQGGFELDVVGIAVPLFDHHAKCAGAVAIAAPSSRMTASDERRILPDLKIAARSITESWQGRMPDD
ncbi:MAG: IclR family transcriptional regulator [Rhizobiaceae bacterium]